MNILKKMTFAAIGAALLTTSAQAQDDNSFCGLDFEAGVEFLWWKPCVDDLSYAAERSGDTSPFTFTIKSVDPGWEPGVRATLSLLDLYCDWDLRLSYSYVHSSETSTIDEEGSIVPVIAHPGTSPASLSDTGKGSWDACCNEWDALLAYDILYNECYSVTTLFGLAGIVLDQEFEAKLVDGEAVSSTKWESDYWGVGFRLGTDYKYRLSDCFQFFVLGNASILTGSADSKNKTDNPDAGEESDLVIKDDDSCQIICGYHIGAGLLYETSLCNYDAHIKLGYEFVQWHNLPNHRIFVSEDDGEGTDVAISTSSNVRTFGFHGLLLGVSVDF